VAVTSKFGQVGVVEDGNRRVVAPAVTPTTRARKAAVVHVVS
jgi:hypothetical protein